MYKTFTAMSNATRTTHRTPGRRALTPMIGSLLRLPHEALVARVLASVNENGFDISANELGGFPHPGPRGRRPMDLARQCNMTRQAMNYVLAGLERRGYIERNAGLSSAGRVVRLTARGWDMVPLVRSCIATIEKEWAAHVGARRFDALHETLHDLSLWLG